MFVNVNEWSQELFVKSEPNLDEPGLETYHFVVYVRLKHDVFSLEFSRNCLQIELNSKVKLVSVFFVNFLVDVV